MNFFEKLGFGGNSTEKEEETTLPSTEEMLKRQQELGETDEANFSTDTKAHNTEEANAIGIDPNSSPEQTGEDKKGWDKDQGGTIEPRIHTELEHENKNAPGEY